MDEYQNLKVDDYSYKEFIYEKPFYIIFKGIPRSGNNGAEVIIKLLKPTFTYTDIFELLRHEYNVLTNANNASLIKPILLIDKENCKAIILENYGDLSLAAFLSKNVISVRNIVLLFSEIANALSEVHNSKIIHNAINPGNIFVDEKSGRIKIVNFENASIVPYQKQHLSSKEFRESSGLYTSPEQTGMTNRSIDYRSDFYALGTVFYETLCRRLPFTYADPVKMLRAIVSEVPVKPHEINPEVPGALSAIVMKLLAKKTEDRYQSCGGIIHDLETCMRSIDNSIDISSFKPGENDIGSTFFVPEKLYGREPELAILSSAYDRAGKPGGKPILAFVSGPPGIGKTSLLQEFGKSLSERKGFFISGKFDQFRRSAPYSAIISAFRNLVDLIVTGADTRPAEWGEKIRRVLGENTSVVTDVIPCLERITGPIPALPSLSPAETEIRFQYVFQNLIPLFTGVDEPLVLMLEDMQWADGPSVNLVESILRNPELSNFIFIASFREDEIDGSYTFKRFHDSIAEDPSVKIRIRLGPLGIDDVEELVSDTLSANRERTKSLSGIIMRQTCGNPFFVNEYVKALSQGKLFGNLVTNNMIDFITGKIRMLPRETQDLLRIASCAGIIIYMNTLSVVANKSADEIIGTLKPAIDEGLVIKLETDLMFHHDRVRKAIYNTLEAGEKERNHYDLGKALLEITHENEMEDRVFPIVHQLNISRRIVNEPEERIRLARLNLKAGLKSKNSIAYGPALVFFNTAKELLPADAWQSQFELKLAVEMEMCEVEYLTGNTGEADGSFDAILCNARDILDKVRAYKAQVPLNTTIGRPEFALAQGHKACELLGLKCPEKPTQLHLMRELVKALVRLKLGRIESFERLPEMTEPASLSAIDLLMNLTLPAYISSPDTIPYLMLRMFNFSVKSGNSPYSAYAYTGFGVILACVLGDIDSGYSIGRYAIDLGEKIDTRIVRCKVNFLFGNLINHWKKPLKEDIPVLEEGMVRGLENGDLTFASFCANHSLAHSILCGEPLPGVVKKGARLFATMKRFKKIESIDAFNLFRQCAINLSNAPGGRCFCASGDFFDENTVIAEWKASKNFTDLGFYYVMKQMLSFMEGDYASCIRSSEEGKQYLGSILGMPYSREHHYYRSLALLANMAFSKSGFTGKASVIVRGTIAKFKKWAVACPENCLHKRLLLEAELAALTRAPAEALRLYDAAIEAAARNGFVNESAMISERAAHYCYARHSNAGGNAYMTRSYEWYARWGTRGKCEVLERIYPHIHIVKRAER